MSLTFHEMPGFLIRRLHQISSSIFCEETTKLKLDITPVQFATLSTLEHFPGVDQTTLAGIIAYDRVTIGGVLQRLIEKGYVDRKVNIHDRRSYNLEISELGAWVLAQLSEATDNAHDGVLVGLSTDERVQLLKLLKKAADASNHRSRSPLVSVTEIRRSPKKAVKTLRKI